MKLIVVIISMVVICPLAMPSKDKWHLSWQDGELLYQEYEVIRGINKHLFDYEDLVNYKGISSLIGRKYASRKIVGVLGSGQMSDIINEYIVESKERQRLRTLRIKKYEQTTKMFYVNITKRIQNYIKQLFNDAMKLLRETNY